MVILGVAMVGFALSVYLGIASLRHRPPAAVMTPGALSVQAPVAGVLYLTQNGGLYKLQGNRFTELQPPGGGWMQPAVAPDHRSLAIIKRNPEWSDLFLLDLDGRPLSQLTRNQGGDLTSDHWAFYPTFSPDGATIYYSLDNPKEGFRVDLSIWALQSAGGSARQWSVPNPYTGGDVAPVSLGGSTIIYSGFGFDEQSHVHSQLYFQARPLEPGRALTTPGEDCGQPALSPDRTRVAMICTGGQQVGRLVVAELDGAGLSARQVLVDGTLCAAPSWEPDGGGLAYLAPAAPGGKFQLWYIQVPSGSPSGPTPRTPIQLTTSLGFDPTSRIAWF